MGTVYLTTHLVMAICIASILYFSFKSYKTINDQEKLPVVNRVYARGLKLVEAMANAGYRIAAGILIAYLK